MENQIVPCELFLFNLLIGCNKCVSDGTSFTDSSMDELSEDSSIHCMQSEV